VAGHGPERLEYEKETIAVDLRFEERQEKLRETMRKFVEQEIPREYARELDEKDEFPHDLIRKLVDYDLARINIPREYGGHGGDILDLMIIFEEIAKRFPTLCWSFGNILLYGNEIIGVNGNTEQKEKYLPRLAKGEIKFSFGLTEPDAGSDAASIRTRAVFDDGHYVINGNKMFITGAGVTEYTITFARTAESKYNGITSFIVDTSLEGYSAKQLEKIGHRGSNTCEVTYENVRVSPGDILGGEEGLNKGWWQEMKLLNQERLVLSSCALGIAQAAFDDALVYARAKLGRTQDKGVAQMIQHQLADMASSVEAIRYLIYAAAWKETKGMQPVMETSISKYFSAETAKRVVTQGLDILGADAALMEHDMQRYLRDIMIYSIGGGTSEIQKNIIAKTLNL
ncbi:MAG: acyl-CoA dehydrogenase family protein, partial [Desulfomonilia bacterium]|nr:acyl-CoA dehydrogenase family protein [Desulfomonilia bacterium]